MNVRVIGLSKSGRTSLVESLRSKGIKTQRFDIEFIDQYPLNWPEKLDSDAEEYWVYVFLDCYVEELLRRGNSQSPKELRLRRRRLLRISIKYNVLYLDTTQLKQTQLEEKFEELLLKYNSNKDNYLNLIENNIILPNPDTIEDQELADKLPIIASGNSKVVRKLHQHYSIIRLKPTIHSHKYKRAGIVEGSEKERLSMTTNILFLLEIEDIPHAYLYVGRTYIICKAIEPSNIPPVEVIVKRGNVGTDKHRYFAIDQYPTRQDPNRKIVNGENREYPDYLVRFDFRNPNEVDGALKGDECLYDDLADCFIDVKEAKRLAYRTFEVLVRHFHKMNIYFQDICFMITTDGSMHYYEISQDCGRYKYIEDKLMTDLDKDIWRSGGSSSMVLMKWKLVSDMIQKYMEESYK